MISNRDEKTKNRKRCAALPSNLQVQGDCSRFPFNDAPSSRLNWLVSCANQQGVVYNLRWKRIAPLFRLLLEKKEKASTHSPLMKNITNQNTVFSNQGLDSQYFQHLNPRR